MTTEEENNVLALAQKITLRRRLEGRMASLNDGTDLMIRWSLPHKHPLAESSVWVDVTADDVRAIVDAKFKPQIAALKV